jgi:prolyl oligopeptidase
MAYMLQESGSDWRTIRVMDAQTKEVLPDEVRWAKFSGIAWKGNGFYYSRYDAPKAGDELKGANEFQKVYYHQVGTAQTADALVHQDPEHPSRGFSAYTTDDERFLVLAGWESTSGNTLLVKDLSNPKADFAVFADGFEHDHSVVGNVGDKLYILTNQGAPNQRLVAATCAKPAAEQWETVLPEQASVLEAVTLAGGKLLARYMVDAAHQMKQFAPDGTLEYAVELPAIGSVSGFQGKPDDQEVFYSFSSFTFPTSLYRYRIASGTSELFRRPEVDFDPEAFETKQVFYQSHDGTKVPMFIVHKKGIALDGKNPTYLYGYGGFNVSLNPSFSVARLFFMECGGIFAMPSLRGGGEYGEVWHKAGTKMQKRNVFLDFIAAAEYLHREGYTSPDYTAIAGGSNGGLLVGAAMTMRPDLCRVALPAVGVLDMLRYQHFTIGRAWATDYGTSEDSREMFEYLLGYSPVHNVKAGTRYPATLVTTADHDDRVVPAHSFKFIAELQAKQAGPLPVLIRIEEKAGHGAGKPTAKYIEEYADIFAFAFHQMGFVPQVAE